MKLRRIVTVSLLAFVAVTLGAIVVQALQEEKPAPGARPAASATPAAAPRPAPARKVLALYLHFTRRCPTCMKIESYAEEAVRKGFATEIASGRLEWKSINVEEPEHARLAADYEISSQSVVLVEMEGERELRWVKLERIWELVHDKVAFQDYVRDELRAFLEEKPGKKG